MLCRYQTKHLPLFFVSFVTPERIFMSVLVSLWTRFRASPRFDQQIFPDVDHKTRLKLQEIVTRLSNNEVACLDERILVQKYADSNSTVWHWLRKARPIRAKGNLDQGSMGGFMQQMNLQGQTSEDHFNGSHDDLGEWFQGSPQWVRRS